MHRKFLERMAQGGMDCIHACPMLAAKLKILEKNPRARYRNENISICGIIAANDQWEESRQ